MTVMMEENTQSLNQKLQELKLSQGILSQTNKKLEEIKNRNDQILDQNYQKQKLKDEIKDVENEISELVLRQIEIQN